MSMGFVKSAYIKEIFGGNKMFKKLKNKKGFTLVELIVVLVILAILAALLIPALTGYIDKANKEKIIAETRQAVMAAQTIVSEDYGSSTPLTAWSVSATGFAGASSATETFAEAVKKLAEFNGTVTDVTVVDGKVTALTYKDSANAKQCAYNKAATDTETMYTVSPVTGG